MSNALQELFKTNRVVGVVGNRSEAKSSLVLTQLVGLAKANPKLNIYVFGVEPKLEEYLSSQGIHFLYNKEDIFDLQIKNSVIYVDEVADFVSTQTRDKQTARFKRFINRIEHNNCWFVLSTAEVGFFNKLACSLINAFLVKQVDFDSLTNGTWLKRLVLGFPSVSEYRVMLEKSQYYMVSNGSLCKKKSFRYNSQLDSKSENVNPFVIKKVKQKVMKKVNQKVTASETKSDEKGDDE